MLITNTYVRFVPAQILYVKILNPHKIFMFHVDQVLFRRAVYETLVCALYQGAHVPPTFELTQRIQRTYSGLRSESTYGSSKRGTLLQIVRRQHASLGQKSFLLLNLVLISHNFNLSNTHILLIPDFLHQ